MADWHSDLVSTVVVTCIRFSGRVLLAEKHKTISFQPVLHDWCNKGRGMCCPVCEMVHIKEHLVLSEIVAHVAAAGFLFRYHNDVVVVYSHQDIMT